MSYKDTVFVPKAQIPTAYKPVVVEAHAKTVWDTEGFESSAATSLPNPTFTLLDGPPYANGNLHMGHILNKTLKDVAAQMMRQRCHKVLWRAGWDCHGLPIENGVRKNLRDKKLDVNELTVVEFRAECRDFARQWVEKQWAQFDRFPLTANFESPYTTMGDTESSTTVQVLHDLLLDGKVYRKRKPVNWSPIDGCAMAEAEMVEKEHTVETLWVKFLVHGGKYGGAHVLVWTTTPWSLPGNAGIAFSRDISYGRYRVDGSTYIVSDPAAVELGLNQRVGDITHDELTAMEVKRPFQSWAYSPLFAADFVKSGKGTGFVHVGPSHSMDDWSAWKDAFDDRPYPQPILVNGSFHEDVEMVGGLRVVKGPNYGEGNQTVIDVLRNNSSLYKTEEQTLTLNHSWRSDGVLLVIDTEQWFVDLTNVRDKPFAPDVKFFPESGRTRMETMLKNRPDWVISRQRNWGTPLAVFLNNKTGEPLIDQSVFDRTSSNLTQFGEDRWWIDPYECLPPEFSTNDYTPVTDVLDVWFDSACVQFHQADRPVDLVVEGTDQSRGWFQASYILSMLVNGCAPWKNVITHGFIIDETSAKLSKSKGNFVTPDTMADRYGAETIRYWVAMSDYAHDFRLADDNLKAAGDQHKKVRNTLRYLVGALEEYDPNAPEVDYGDIETRGYYLLCRFTNKMEDHVEKFEFAKYTRELARFCSEDLSAFLFECRKDSLYCDGSTSPKRLAYLDLLKKVYDQLIRYAQPIMPCTVEEVHSVYKFRTRPASHLLLTGERVDVSMFTPEWLRWWDLLLEYRSRVYSDLNEAKDAGVIKTPLETCLLIPEPIADVDVLEDFIGVGSMGQCLKIDNGPEFMVVKADELNKKKCDRCWKHNVHVDSERDICIRCDAVVTSKIGSEVHSQ
jgi:isoleucyl-tRNA synthetase